MSALALIISITVGELAVVVRMLTEIRISEVMPQVLFVRGEWGNLCINA